MLDEIKFGPWLPDVSDHKNPGLEGCTNALPGPGGYVPFQGAGTEVADVGAAVLSARSFERSDGTRVTVCATAGDLHAIVGGSVTDAGLGLALTDPVQFVRYGAAVYACNKSGAWYISDIESGATFVAVGVTIPKGLAMGRISDFLFMGNLTDTDASDKPYRIRWSPFNDPASNWTADIGTQSGSVDMPQDLGPVTAISGGNIGLIFQKRGISRIAYVGGSVVFAKEVIDTQRGCTAPFSVVEVGETRYFLSDDGFFATEGTSARPISRGRVWKWFQENSSETYLADVQGAVDWPNRCVMWTVMGSTGMPVGLLAFNWETEWWSAVDVTVDCILASGKDGLTLEQVAAIYPDLDAMTLSLDDPAFAARGRVLAGFFSGSLRPFSGTTLAAEFETGEFQPVSGRRTFIRGVTPLITDAANGTTASLLGRERQNLTFSGQSNVAMTEIGLVPFNVDARYFRARLSCPAGASWRDAYGFQVEYDVSGET